MKGGERKMLYCIGKELVNITGILIYIIVVSAVLNCTVLNYSLIKIINIKYIRLAHAFGGFRRFPRTFNFLMRPPLALCTESSIYQKSANWGAIALPIILLCAYPYSIIKGF